MKKVLILSAWMILLMILGTVISSLPFAFVTALFNNGTVTYVDNSLLSFFVPSVITVIVVYLLLLLAYKLIKKYADNYKSLLKSVGVAMIICIFIGSLSEFLYSNVFKITISSCFATGCDFSYVLNNTLSDVFASMGLNFVLTSLTFAAIVLVIGKAYFDKD